MGTILRLLFPVIKELLFGKHNLFNYFVNNRIAAILLLFCIFFFLMFLYAYEQAFLYSQKLVERNKEIATLSITPPADIQIPDVAYLEKECDVAEQPEPRTPPPRDARSSQPVYTRPKPLEVVTVPVTRRKPKRDINDELDMAFGESR